MKLYTTLRSPYGRKALVMAIEKGLENKIEIILENLQEKSEFLKNNNPLGQVPTLLTDDNDILFDSPVIAEYIDSINSNPKLIPTEINQRIEVLKISALVDGMIENAINVFYEGIKADNLKDLKKHEKCKNNLENCFLYLENNILNFSNKVNMASIAVASGIGYIDFRLTELGWKNKHPKLAAWFAEFSKRDSMQKTQPKA